MDSALSALAPLISVVMPVFNAEAYLDESIRSVLGQTLSNFELITIDDGSSDGSNERLLAWALKDERIRLIKNSTNQGISASRNLGIAEAQADLIAFVDADDQWLANKLALQYEHHQQTSCCISCTAFWFGRAVVNAKPQIDYKDLLANNVVNTSSVMVDTRFIKLEFTLFQPSEDYQHWLAISRSQPIHFIQTPLVRRIVFEGVSSNKIKMVRQRWHIYRKIENLSFLTAAFYLAYYGVTGVKKYWRRGRALQQ